MNELKNKAVRGIAAFLSIAMLVCATATVFADTAAEKIDDAKAEARETRREAKKGLRDATGRSNKLKDAKEKAEVMKDNAADDAARYKKQIQD